MLIFCFSVRAEALSNPLVDYAALSSLSEPDFNEATRELLKRAAEITPGEALRLIGDGADLSARDRDTWATPLMEAVSKIPDPGVTRVLIDAGADVNARGWFRKTPLMYAARNANTEVLDILLGAGADVGAEYRYGKTPLMYAVKSNTKPEILRTFIDAGADVNLKDMNGKTPLIYATENVNPEILSVSWLWK